MLEGEAIVDASRAIYHHQGASAEVDFAANGSSASDLALVMNEVESRSIDAMRHEMSQNKAAVVVVKRGHWGTTVLSGDSEYHVSAFSRPTRSDSASPSTDRHSHHGCRHNRARREGRGL